MRTLNLLAVPLLLASLLPAAAADTALPSSDTPPGEGGMPGPVYSGPLASVGRTLHDNGIDLQLDFVDFYQNAPSFGAAGGSSANYGMFILGVTGNLTPDLRVNLVETINAPTQNVDNYLFDLSNAFFPVPIVNSDTDLTRFTIEGDLFNDRLTVEAGRMGLNRDFMKKGFCGGIGCVPSTPAITLNMPGEALSVWGGRLAYRLDQTTTLGFGAIEDNSDNWQNGDGWDWGTGDAKGYIAIANISHDETFMQNANPLKYEVGAYHRSTSYEDALYNSGWGNPTFGANTKIVNHDGGTSGVYGQVRKVVWSEASGSPIPENLAVYGGLFHTFGDGQAYPWEAYAGVEYSGFWKENPLATVGASVHYIRLSEERAQYEQNARRFFSGVNEKQPQDTFMVDVHASTGFFGNGILDFGAAYIINPNNSILADYSTGREKNGVVIYAALAFDLGGSLGLSPRKGP
ncbi:MULTISPECIES: carbohydrate porin [Rhizobium/Agrobacterium group]|uniref:Carbohydrate-selective porin n=2 Tax=Rhizobium/Agrobacterium group TaxID=227290 RepID=B9K0R2_ALLAM|nr:MULTISPECIES: carbohydrate porin [Rhizobium/Agrobacterium group]ACM38460.1 Carbohydrate-selective porin [Allorhizobium ampelinum S4]MCF1445624.1 carbohydrate porin [Allorhizobium ampelinum]MUO26843.1 porin [Agrobacterium vitis]MUO40261.1 porin [Agrobacterium vitis]MUP08684.1 porin [Agrobacterium vitis]